ncbi:MAG TPA: hypothetical protein PKY77_05795 [Phycisphaerae bacterium]|nr:hypothetical protein [Phycisphaerae bacterium]HRY69043.1 hypothetical protein [Phycisphaerae bacterium]HSA25982.1 hypothetical protein [Phycisphaerae bacterium]
MANDVLSFAGTQIGDMCLRATIEVHRGQGGSVETGAMRQYALLDDPSPNLYYLLKAVVTKVCDDSAELCRWSAAMGYLMTLSKRDVQITGPNAILMEDAVLVGPVVVPVSMDAHPGKALEMEFVFVSVTPPS